MEEDLTRFEGYLLFDVDGEPIAIKQEAPQNLKIDFRNWYIDRQDRIRLAELFETQY